MLLRTLDRVGVTLSPFGDRPETKRLAIMQMANGTVFWTRLGI